MISIFLKNISRSSAERKVLKMYNRKKLDDQDNSKIENIAKLVPNGKKKWVRYDEGAILYSLGINSFRQLAKDAKAIYRVNRIVLVNTEKVDEYLELTCADDPSDF